MLALSLGLLAMHTVMMGHDDAQAAAVHPQALSSQHSIDHQGAAEPATTEVAPLCCPGAEGNLMAPACTPLPTQLPSLLAPEPSGPELVPLRESGVLTDIPPEQNIARTPSLAQLSISRR